MARRKAGIGQSGLERFRQGLQDLGTQGRYEAAFEEAVRQVNPLPPETPQYEPEYDPVDDMSRPELLAALGLDGDTFNDQDVVSSTRVKSIRYEPYASTFDVNDLLRDAVRRRDTSIALDGIDGVIKVSWVNGKRDWGYRDTTLGDFIKFKRVGETGRSYGKYVNNVMNYFSHGAV